MQHFALTDAMAAENEGFALRAKWEAESRRAAGAALWRKGADRDALAMSWDAPDEEETAMLCAAAALARRRLGAPVAAVALAGSQAGVILTDRSRDPMALPVNDPAVQLLRAVDGGKLAGIALRDAAAAPDLAGSALMDPLVEARAVLTAPVQLRGGPVFGLLIAAARCETEPTAAQRRELILLGERTAEEILARGAARVDPDTGALTMIGLGASVEREARRRAEHGRPASVAVIALPTAPGAPRLAPPPREGAEEELAQDFAIADAARLSPQALRAAVEETSSVVRESDMVASVPTPTVGLRMDVALDIPSAPQMHGPTCIAVLMPDTDAAGARACLTRLVSALSTVELPGGAPRHLCASAGIAEIGAARADGREAAVRALNAAYAALERARRDQRCVASDGEV